MSDYDAYAASSAIVLITFIITMVFVVGFYALTAVALMSFFRKVGVEPWIAWVPVYNNWKWLEVGGFQGWISLLGLIYGGSIVTSIFLYIGMYRTGLAFRKDGGFLVLGIFFPFIWAFILGGKTTVYEPQLITAAGYPPPIAGFGSLPYKDRAQYGFGQPASSFGDQPQQPYGQPPAQHPQQQYGQPQAPQYGQPQAPQYGQPQAPYQPPQPPVPPIPPVV